MSSLLYGTITRQREIAPSGTSTDSSAPGLRTYVDAMAGLVPAEVLAIHALLISSFTQKTGDGATEVRPDAVNALKLAFVLLCVLAMVLFAVGLRRPQPLDFVRVFIPPAAFVLWTMLQSPSAFDVVAPGVDTDIRLVLGLIVGALVGAAASVLGVRADLNDPRRPKNEPTVTDKSAPASGSGEQAPVQPGQQGPDPHQVDQEGVVGKPS